MDLDCTASMDYKAPLAWKIIIVLMCAVTILFYFYEFMLRVAPGIMTHELMQSYHLNARSFGSLSVSFYYIYAPMQLIVGLLFDRYGPRRLLTFAAMVSALGAYFFASMQSYSVAILGRVFIGLGASFAFVGILKVATIWFSTKRYGIISGCAMAVGMMGGVVGDVIFMNLMRNEGWRLSYYFVSCFGLVLALLIFLLLRDHRAEIDDPNFVDNSVSFEVLSEDLVTMIRNPQFWLNALVGGLLMMPVIGFAECWQIPYLSFVSNLNQVDAVTATSMVFAGWAFSGPLLGWLSDALKIRCLPITIGIAFSAIILSYVIYVPLESKTTLYVLLFLYGAFSSVQSICYAICCERAPRRLSATAISLTNMVVMLSGVSVYLVGSLLEHLWGGGELNGLHVYAIPDYQLAFLIFPIGLVIATVLSFYLKER